MSIAETENSDGKGVKTDTGADDRGVHAGPRPQRSGCYFRRQASCFLAFFSITSSTQPMKRRMQGVSRE
jgi:hypothetical protein